MKSPVRMEEARAMVRTMKLAQRLEFIAGLLGPTETVPCTECGQMKKVKTRPLITTEQAVLLLEEESTPEYLPAGTKHTFVFGRFGLNYCVQGVDDDYCKRGPDHEIHEV